MPLSQDAIRIIDENLNRTAEGLRVLEDVVRMVLNDSELTQQLKTIRHRAVQTDTRLQGKLLQSRNAGEDVGTNLQADGDAPEKDFPEIIIANSRRVQESLRVLEELAKLPDSPFDSDMFKQTRFNLYTLERNVFSRLQRRDKLTLLNGVYAVIDTRVLQKRDPVEAAGQIIKGGAHVIQLRDKSLPKNDLIIVAKRLKHLCSENGTLFIVNDYLDIALASDADGLHVGQADLPVIEARKFLPITKIIGCSVVNAAQAVKAQAEGADYIAPGAIFITGSKDAPVIGLGILREIRQSVTVPIVAIGGINRQNAAQVISAGAQSIAVISSILENEDFELATRQLLASIGR